MGYPCNTMTEIDPKQFIITRKRKKYKFALFHNSPLCFEAEEWAKTSDADVLEMGAGTGLFSVALAANQLGKQFIAFDIKADRLQHGARKAEKEGVSNLRFLRGRADLINEYFAPSSLDSIWVTFPDPFPKDRSAKHRLTHPRFLKLYDNLLKTGGALYFKTDARKLFDWSLEQLVAEGWRIQELSFDLHKSELSDDYKIMTTYEKRYTAEGIPINFVKALPPKGEQ